MKPLVSIIIPCHNAEPWLAATLASALAQTATPTEIIVVDDASTDASRDIAGSFCSRGVKLLEVSRHNAAAARNAGLRASTGDFIQFLDADDQLSPDKIEAQLLLLQHAPSHSLSTCRWGRFTTDILQTSVVNDDVFQDFSPIEFLMLCANSYTMMHPGAWLCPRSVIEKAGYWDERLTLNDDGEFFARLACASSGLRFCASGLSYYRSAVPGSLSARRDDKSRRSQFLSVELIGQQLLGLEDSPRSHAALANLYQRFVYDFFPTPPDLMNLAETRIRTLGGSSLPPPMGRRSAFLARLIGWKNLWRLRALR